MSAANVYWQYGNIVTSESGFDVINNIVSRMLDLNPNNDLSILSSGLLENGLLVTGMNSMQANLNMGSNYTFNLATSINPIDECNEGYPLLHPYYMS